MTIGELKHRIEPLDDDLHIIASGPTTDADGDDCEAWFGIRTIALEMDADTAEPFVKFGCDQIDVFDTE